MLTLLHLVGVDAARMHIRRCRQKYDINVDHPLLLLVFILLVNPFVATSLFLPYQLLSKGVCNPISWFICHEVVLHQTQDPP